MATRGEQQVFAFLVIVGGLGIVARWMGVRRFDRDVAQAVAPAASASSALTRAVPWEDRVLTAQQRAVDSALAARNTPRSRPTKRSRRDSLVSVRVFPSRQGQDASRALRNSTDYAGSVIRSGSQPVDINRATADELERLPRVGPALARRIIERRTSHGPFHSLDDLRHVRGIGPATARLVAPLVTFSGRHSPLHSEGRF